MFLPKVEKSTVLDLNNNNKIVVSHVIHEKLEDLEMEVVDLEDELLFTMSFNEKSE